MKSYFILIINLKIKIASCLFVEKQVYSEITKKVQFRTSQLREKKCMQVQRNKGKVIFYQAWRNYEALSWTKADKNNSSRLSLLVQAAVDALVLYREWHFVFLRVPWAPMSGNVNEASRSGLPNYILNEIFSTYFQNMMTETI